LFGEKAMNVSLGYAFYSASRVYTWRVSMLLSRTLWNALDFIAGGVLVMIAGGCLALAVILVLLQAIWGEKSMNKTEGYDAFWNGMLELEKGE
jgi:ammonia channel protein AmtB